MKSTDGGEAGGGTRQTHHQSEVGKHRRREQTTMSQCVVVGIGVGMFDVVVAVAGIGVKEGRTEMTWTTTNLGLWERVEEPYSP